MRVALLSDIHDNIWKLADVLAQIRDCDALLCLGDFCAPFTLTAITDVVHAPVHVVWGNNDGDKLLLVRNGTQAGNVTFHGELAELELDGRKVAMTHYPNVARALAASGLYALACHGHNHRRSIARPGKTLLLNPGEVMGRFGVSSYALYDTVADEAQIVEL